MQTVIPTVVPVAARRHGASPKRFTERLRSAVRTLRAPAAGSGRPVLLIDGFASTSALAGGFARELEASLGRPVVVVDVPSGVDDLVEAAEIAERELVRLAAGEGFEFADVVGHGSGGLVATYLLKRIDRGRHVRNVVTLGTPHRGAHFSRLGGAAPPVVSRALEQSRPGSPLVEELKWLPTPGGCRVVSIAGTADRLVPEASAELTSLPGHRNLCVAGASHLGLVFSSEALQLLGRALGRMTGASSTHAPLV